MCGCQQHGITYNINNNNDNYNINNKINYSRTLFLGFSMNDIKTI